MRFGEKEHYLSVEGENMTDSQEKNETEKKVTLSLNL
jgi:hypothetical protein